MKQGMPPKVRVKKSVEDEAAEWFAKMRSDIREPRLQSEFKQWLSADPEHEREYRAFERMWADCSSLSSEEAVIALRQEAMAESKRVLKPHGIAWRRDLRALAAGVAIVGIGIFLTMTMLPLQRASYQTEPGDRHTVYLADDSEVTLNTDSAIRVEFTLFSRRVFLERGQAHFKVAHAVVRPFEVDAGSGLIRALGTAFDVYRHGDNVEVTLIQGKVDVASLPPADSSSAVAQHTVLTPGQQVRVTTAGISTARVANISSATAWLSGRLVFEDERLGDVVQEVNRYSSVKLIVIDPDLADVHISGVFRAGRAETFIDALRSSYPVKATAVEGGLLVEPNTSMPWPMQSGAHARMQEHAKADTESLVSQ